MHLIICVITQVDNFLLCLQKVSGQTSGLCIATSVLFLVVLLSILTHAFSFALHNSDAPKAEKKKQFQGMIQGDICGQELTHKMNVVRVIDFSAVSPAENMHTLAV